MNRMFPSLFILLIIFVFIDYITTYYGVGILQAIELNPLYSLCGNLFNFMIVKTILTSLCFIGLFILEKEFPYYSILTLIFLNVLYAIAIISNIYEIGNEII